MGYQPAGRHLESGYLNLFEVRVSCRGIGQRVWRAEEEDLKPLLLLLIPPASLSLQGATSQAPGSQRGAGGREGRAVLPRGTGGSREGAGAASSACQGLAKGMAAGLGMQYLRRVVEGKKEGGRFYRLETSFLFFFCTLALFFFPHFLHYLYINADLFL